MIGFIVTMLVSGTVYIVSLVSLNLMVGFEIRLWVEVFMI